MHLVYSYAHEDTDLCKELDKHLSLLRRQGLIETWYDRDISAGAVWAYEIDQHFNAAQIVLLLISPDFMASEYCYSIEMAQALERHETGEAIVIPIILRPVDWKTAPFGKLLALPNEGKAVTTWDNRDLAFAQIVKGIRNIVEPLKGAHIALPKPNTNFTLSVKPLWAVPYRQNLLFTGREKFLAYLYTVLNQTPSTSQIQPLAISGLGGIGKTQIAIEYTYRYQDLYQTILWANAATRDTVVTDFVSFADLLNLSAREEIDQDLIIKAVKRWLADHERWLLILDNIDHPALIDDLLPIRGNGHIILTTRAQAIGAIAQSVEIEKMDGNEGIELLLRRAKILQSGGSLNQIPQEIITQTREVVTIVDGLPLALDQAGAYIEETGCSVADYLERYQQKAVALLNRRGEGSIDHPASVVATWSLSFEQIQQHYPPAADLLRFCAFLAPDAIPLEYITMNAGELGPHLRPIATDVSLLDDAILHLRRFSLVRRNRDHKTLSLHRLVQAVLKANMDADSQRLWAERAVQSVVKSFPSIEETTWMQCQRYLPHVHECVALIDEYHLTHIETAELFYHAGRWLHEHAQYKEAEIFYQRALDAERQQNNHNHPFVAKILDSLAWLYLDQGLYQMAAPLYQQALIIKQQVLGPEHPEVAITLHALGRLHQAEGDFSQAETFYQRALAIKECSLGSNAPETATTIHALAWLYLDQGWHARAEPLYQRALNIRKNALGMKHASTAITFDQLARLYHQQKRYAEAEAFYRQSLTIKEEVLSPDHPFTAITLDSFARLYHDQHLYGQAEALYRRALTIRERVLGPDHPFTAATLHHLARLYHEQRLYTQAETLYQQALTIREQTLGSNHIITAITLHQLAQLYESQGQNMQAEHCYQRTLNIREDSFGRIASPTISVAKKYAHFLRTLGRVQEAMELEELYSVE